MSKNYGQLLVEGKNVVKDFPISSTTIQTPMMRAINDVSFKMYKSRGLAVVGESGSGKSTTAKMIAKMYAPTDGVIEYKGRDIQTIASKRDLMTYREGVQMVWQDPFGSLNPTHNIFHHILRPLLIHKKVDPRNKREQEERVYDLLEQVGLIPPKETAQKYPHQLSGGQRQRINPCRCSQPDGRDEVRERDVAALHHSRYCDSSLHRGRPISDVCRTHGGMGRYR